MIFWASPDEWYSRASPDEWYSRASPDEWYSRNASCALNLIFTFFFTIHGCGSYNVLKKSRYINLIFNEIDVFANVPRFFGIHLSDQSPLLINQSPFSQIVTEYLRHKWQLICSICRIHNSALSSFMTYHRVCNKSNTTGSTCGAGTAYTSGAPEFTTGYQWGFCFPILSFSGVFCRSLFVLCRPFFCLAIVLSVLLCLAIVLSVLLRLTATVT